MYNFVSTLLFLLLAIVPTDAAPKAPIPEPTERPQWLSLRVRSEALMKAELFDPESAQFTWTSGFEWGSVKPSLRGRIWGWVGCVSINAKNRMGGYVGVEERYVVYQPDIGYSWGRSDYAYSQCDTPAKVPLQSALIASSAPAIDSAADQLAKLAALLDKRLITRDEFNAEKKRLLNRP